MSSLALPLEFEFSASKIAAAHHPNTRFKLIAEIKKDFLRIDFQGYFTENFAPKNRPYSNPINDSYRNKRVDFWLLWSSGELALSGWWRTEILSLEYTPFMQSWSNEDGEEIARPYPDGDKFEAIAASLYPILQQYFQI
ncbi:MULTISPECIES: hypothetical protein [Nostocales]|uniref:hypothetical protein n=1 Tax=Nostocales TaxID=1161 RepID=UPI0005EAA8B7|nr:MULTISPECIES: hypothetical protein [Nostocales]BAY95061.1 hypothetical protein NIES3275_71180 [Microchaete diplosiphon NIES-3275]EKE98010.1 hypothetical protein FDUTEX481_04579 [Tolypothrix sp. PCC 7601]MBE9080624.1 hypothetical protein [Tolypothrix sp. LEGE 11397]UYD30415.1 hypothetical protein HGR01_36060 [Tolypothrix sp. PCC 7712]UYD38144.1 hypothetical protein HG267_37195 [Tolypothrix sp. PCC 7601]